MQLFSEISLLAGATIVGDKSSQRQKSRDEGWGWGDGGVTGAALAPQKSALSGVRCGANFRIIITVDKEIGKGRLLATTDLCKAGLFIQHFQPHGIPQNFFFSCAEQITQCTDHYTLEVCPCPPGGPV